MFFSRVVRAVVVWLVFSKKMGHVQSLRTARLRSWTLTHGTNMLWASPTISKNDFRISTPSHKSTVFLDTDDLFNLFSLASIFGESLWCLKSIWFMSIKSVTIQSHIFPKPIKLTLVFNLTISAHRYRFLLWEEWCLYHPTGCHWDLAIFSTFVWYQTLCNLRVTRIWALDWELWWSLW